MGRKPVPISSSSFFLSANGGKLRPSLLPCHFSMNGHRNHFTATSIGDGCSDRNGWMQKKRGFNKMAHQQPCLLIKILITANKIVSKKKEGM